MADVRIQDFNENLKPDTNNDFLMTFKRCFLCNGARWRANS